MQTYIQKNKFFILFLMSVFFVSSAYVVYVTSKDTMDTVKEDKESFLFTISHYDMTTEGKILTFDISLNKARHVQTIVTFSTINISAEKHKDYTLLDTQIVIPAGQTEAKVRVQTLDDNDSEAIEFFTLKGKVSLSNGDSATRKVIGIIRDNTAPVKLWVGESTVREGEALMVDINISYARETDTIVHLSHSDISAEKGKDYAWQDKEIIIPAYATHTTVRIKTFTDEIFEIDENFVVQAEIFLQNTTIVAKATATIQNNTPPLKLLIGNAVAKEGEKLLFDLNLSVESARDIIISLTSTENSAESDKDYKLPVTGVTISAGDRHTTLEVDALKDTISEHNETFILNGQISLYNKVYVAKAEGTIIDTTKDLNVSIVDKHIIEGESMQFEVLLNHPSSEDTVLILHTIDKTATKEKDYEGLTTKVLTIPKGFLKGKVNIGLSSDEIVEKNETFILNAEINSSFSKGYEVNATGTIINK